VSERARAAARAAAAVFAEALFADLGFRLVLLVLRITTPFFVPRRTFEGCPVRSGLRRGNEVGKWASTVKRVIVMPS
jgi:hypothetical protein